MMFFRELGRFNTAWLFLWIGVLFVPACKEIDRSEVPAPIINPSIVAVDDAASEVTGISDDLGEIAESITVATDAIEKKDVRKAMKPEVKVLREEVPRIESERQELDRVSSSLTATSIALHDARKAAQRLKEARSEDAKVIERLKNQIIERDSQIAELHSESSRKSKKLMTLTALLGVVCIAACAMLMFNGKGGIGLGVFGIALVVGSTAASWIMSHAWIAGVAVLIAVGLIIWKLIEFCQSRKANEELVATTEKIKKYIPPEAKRREFGDMVGDGEVGNLQSTTTKKIVGEYRKRLQSRVVSFIDKEKP